MSSDSWTRAQVAAAAHGDVGESDVHPCRSVGQSRAPTANPSGVLRDQVSEVLVALSSMLIPAGRGQPRCLLD